MAAVETTEDRPPAKEPRKVIRACFRWLRNGVTAYQVSRIPEVREVAGDLLGLLASLFG